MSLAVPLLLASPTSQRAGQPRRPRLLLPSRTQQTAKPKALKTETELTLVNVTVTDPMDRLVTGLEQENFRVYEDGVEQEIVNFSSEDVPVSIGVIFDMSGSMRRQDRQVAPRRRAVFPHRESAGRIFPGRISTTARSWSALSPPAWTNCRTA